MAEGFPINNPGRASVGTLTQDMSDHMLKENKEKLKVSLKQCIDLVCPTPAVLQDAQTAVHQITEAVHQAVNDVDIQGAAIQVFQAGDVVHAASEHMKWVWKDMHSTFMVTKARHPSIENIRQAKASGTLQLANVRQAVEMVGQAAVPVYQATAYIRQNSEEVDRIERNVHQVVECYRQSEKVLHKIVEYYHQPAVSVYLDAVTVRQDAVTAHLDAVTAYRAAVTVGEAMDSYRQIKADIQRADEALRLLTEGNTNVAADNIQLITTRLSQPFALEDADNLMEDFHLAATDTEKAAVHVKYAGECTQQAAKILHVLASANVPAARQHAEDKATIQKAAILRMIQAMKNLMIDLTSDDA